MLNCLCHAMSLFDEYSTYIWYTRNPTIHTHTHTHTHTQGNNQAKSYLIQWIHNTVMARSHRINSTEPKWTGSASNSVQLERYEHGLNSVHTPIITVHVRMCRKRTTLVFTVHGGLQSCLDLLQVENNILWCHHSVVRRPAYHSPRGSGSRVFTATGLVSGD